MSTGQHERTSERRVGVILAAGRGRRMGRTKQLIPWPAAPHSKQPSAATPGQRPLIAVAYDAIRGVCDAMVVVLGHEAEAVAAALGDRPFHRVVSDPHGPMFESIRAGLAAAQAIDTQATVVLHPGDHPHVAAETLTGLFTAAAAHPGRAILPKYQGRGGHPLLIPPPLVARLLTADCPHGLGRFWAEHPELCHRQPVADAGVVFDVDTPGDIPSDE